MICKHAVHESHCKLCNDEWEREWAIKKVMLQDHIKAKYDPSHDQTSLFDLCFFIFMGTAAIVLIWAFIEELLSR